MGLAERVIQEYADTKGTEFWKLYLAEIEKHKKSKSETLESCGVDELKGYQGEIRALKFLVGLPDRIIRELAEKEKI